MSHDIKELLQQQRQGDLQRRSAHFSEELQKLLKACEVQLVGVINYQMQGIFPGIQVIDAKKYPDDQQPDQPAEDQSNGETTNTETEATSTGAGEEQPEGQAAAAE